MLHLMSKVLDFLQRSSLFLHQSLLLWAVIGRLERYMKYNRMCQQWRNNIDLWFASVCIWYQVTDKDCLHVYKYLICSCLSLWL